MAGIGDSWGTKDELLHPRGPDGRWIRKAGIAKSIIARVLDALASFRPRMFQNQSQANQYLRNVASKKPGRFNGGRGYSRLLSDLGPTNEDLRDGVIDNPSTSRFIKMMDDSATELPDDVILSRIVGVDAFGFTPQTAQGTSSDTDPGIRGVSGKLLAERGYSITVIGEPRGAAPQGSVRMVIAGRKGTKVIIPAAGQEDSTVFLDRDQPLRVTKVEPDGSGGWVMYALTDEKRPREVPTPIGGPVGAGVRDSKQREASIREGERIQAAHQKRPDDEAEAADEERRRIAAEEAAGRPVTPSPMQDAERRRIELLQQQAGVQPRTEPIQARSIGGEPRPETAPGGQPQAPEAPAPQRRVVDLRLAVRDAGIRRPEAGKNRKQWNDAYEGIISGKKDPIDAAQELERDADDLDAMGHPDGESFRQLSELIQREYGTELPPAKKAGKAAPVPRTAQGLPKITKSQLQEMDERQRAAKAGKAGAPEAPPAPTPVKAPAKQSGMSPDQEDRVVARARQFRGNERNDEERRIVSQADEILARRRGEATPEMRATKALRAPAKMAPAKKVAAPAKKAAPEAPGDDLDKMTKQQLLDEAARREFEVPKSWNKDRIKKLIREERFRKPEKKTPQQQRDIRRTDQELERQFREREAAGEAVPQPDTGPAPVERIPISEMRQRIIDTPEAERYDLIRGQLDHRGLAESRRLARAMGAQGLGRSNRDQIAEGIRRHFEGASTESIEAPAKKAAKAAVPGAAPGTAAGKITAGRLQPGMRILVTPQGNPTNRKTGQRTLTIESVDRVQGGSTTSGTRSQRSRIRIIGRDEDGNQITVPGDASPSQTFIVAPEPGAAPAKKATPGQFNAGRKAEEVSAAMTGAPGRERVQQGIKAMNDLNMAQLRQVAKELGIGVPGKDREESKTPEALREFIARNLDSFGSVGEGLQESMVRTPTPAKKAAAPAPERLTPSETLTRLSDQENPLSREQAQDMVSGFNKTQLQEMAKELSIPGRAKLTKPELQREIVEATVGRRQDSVAIRGFTEGRPELAPLPDVDPVVEARNRQAKIDRAKGYGRLGAELDELITNGATTEAISARVRTRLGKQDPAWADTIDRMLQDGDLDGARAFVDRIMRADDVSLQGKAGDVVPFDRRLHRGIAGDIPDGAMVHIVRPGYSTKWDDEDIPVERATVEVAAPDEVSAKVGRTEVARKAVPKGSVKGDRPQAPIDNEPRKRTFTEAWDAAELGVEGSPGRSMKEIRDDVASGKITPEEGIRRLEDEIAFNKEDIAEIDANLRQPDLSDAERTKLQSNAAVLQNGVEAQQKASKFMRLYFRDEKPTVKEVEVNLDAEGFKALQEATPDTLREAAKESGLEPPKGETKDEILQDLIRQVAGRVVRERAAKKAPTKKAAKAAKKAAPQIPIEREKLDVRTIGAGIDFDENDSWVKRTLDSAQKALDGEDDSVLGKNATPAAVGRYLDEAATRRMTTAVYEHGSWHAESSLLTPEQQSERRAFHQAEYDRAKDTATKIRELAERLKATRRRPAKKAAAPEVQAAETRADTVEARLINEHLERLNSARTRDQGNAALEGLTMPELRRIGEQMGVKGRSKQELRDKILDRFVPEVQTPEARAELEGRQGQALERLRKQAAPSVPGRSPSPARRGREQGIVPPDRAFSDVSGGITRADQMAQQGASNTEIARMLRERAAVAAKADLNEEGRRFMVEQDRDTLLSIRKSGAEYLRRLATMLQQEEKKERPAKKAAPSAPDADKAAEIKRLRDHARVTRELAGMRQANNPPGSFHHNKGLQDEKDADRLDAEADALERGSAPEAPTKKAPAKKAAPSAPAPRMSQAPILPNSWGGRLSEIHFHQDGIIGGTIRGLGEDKSLDVDGEPLANALGRLATRAVTGEISQQQMIQAMKQLVGRFPEGSDVRKRLDRMVEELDAPEQPPLPLPEGTPDPIRDLMQALSQVPLARRRDLSRGGFNEMEALQEIAQDTTRPEGPRRWRHMESEIRRKLLNHRHESQEGKFEIDRAIQEAMRQLKDMVESARTASPG
jgi:hypothetical protein